MEQGDDPFGEVDSAPFQNSMSVTGYVRLGGEVFGPEAVVAAYMGSELRGKSSPQSSEGAYANMMSLLIYGDKRGEPIHFKVFTGRRVIEVDQGVTYVVDQRLGTLRQPYNIDLPAPVVTTFFEEGWSTTCLHYNAEIPDGVTVWIVTGIKKIENSKMSNRKWFELQGRSIENTSLRKGIYVINGKKTIIK